MFERKLDGMRILALVEPGRAAPASSCGPGTGARRPPQFPDLVKDLRRFATSLRRTVMLDGEVVAAGRTRPAADVPAAGGPHPPHRANAPSRPRRAARRWPSSSSTCCATAADDLRPLSLVQRRARLEKIIGNAGSELLRFGDQSPGGDGRRLARAGGARASGKV